VSEVIGLKENSSGDSGIVTVRTEGLDESDELVLSFARWVMVRKRDPKSPATAAQVPELAGAVDATLLIAPPSDRFRRVL